MAEYGSGVYPTKMTVSDENTLRRYDIYDHSLASDGKNHWNTEMARWRPPDPLYPKSGNGPLGNGPFENGALGNGPFENGALGNGPLPIGTPSLSRPRPKPIYERGYYPDTPTYIARYRSAGVRIDGVPLKSKSWARVVLRSTLVVLACAITAYELYKNVYDYVSSPVSTTYTTHSVVSLPFPDVYICPMNPVNETKRTELKLDTSWLGLLTRANGSRPMTTLHLIGGRGRPGPNTTMDDLVNETVQSSLPPAELVDKEEDAPPEAAPPTVDEVTRYFMELGYDTDQFFESCSFDSLIYKPCSIIAEPILDRNRGVCFLISGTKFIQVTGGRGLSLLLNTPVHGSVVQGARVRVQHRHDPASDIGVLVAPGEYMAMTLKRKDFSLLKSCVREEDYPEFLILNSTVALYSQESCKLDCSQWSAWKNCRCLQIIDMRYLNFSFFYQSSISIEHELSIGRNIDRSIDPHRPSVIHQRPRFCTSDQLARCATDLIDDPCFERCRTPCEWTEYEVSTSSAKLNLKNHVLLDIAFDRMRLIEIGQIQSMTFDALISHIGGLMSLFLGASLLALVHAVISCFCWCIRKLRW